MTKSYYPSKRSSAFVNAGEPRTYSEAEADAIVAAAVAAALAAANGEAAGSDPNRPTLADRVRVQLKGLTKAEGLSSERMSLADRVREQLKRR